MRTQRLKIQRELSPCAVPVIKKAYLYDVDGGEVLLNYEDWAVHHVQDEDAAWTLATSLLEGDGISSMFNVEERVFEVYSLLNPNEFRRQMDAYHEEEESN